MRKLEVASLAARCFLERWPLLRWSDVPVSQIVADWQDRRECRLALAPHKVQVVLRCFLAEVLGVDVLRSESTSVLGDALLPSGRFYKCSRVPRQEAGQPKPDNVLQKTSSGNHDTYNWSCLCLGTGYSLLPTLCVRELSLPRALVAHCRILYSQAGKFQKSS